MNSTYAVREGFLKEMALSRNSAMTAGFVFCMTVVSEKSLRYA